MSKKILFILPLFFCCNNQTSKNVKLTKSISLEKTVNLAACSESFRIGEYPEDNWWESFNDSYLTCLVEKALKDNPSLQSVKERVDMANNQALEVRSQLFPQISGLFQYAWLYLADSHVLQSLIPTLENSEYLYNLLFNFNYEFDFFGKNRKKYEAALGDANASKLLYEEAKIILVTSITKSYFNLTAMKAKKKIVEEMYQNKERLYSLIRIRKKNRINSQIDENKVKESLNVYEQMLIAVNGEIKLEESLLNILSGANPEGSLVTTPCYKAFMHKLEFPEEITSTLLVRRPDLLASLWIAKKNAINIGVSVRNFLPNIAIIDTPVLFTGKGGNLFSKQSLANVLMPILTQPLFEGGRLWSAWRKSVSVYKSSIYSFNYQFLQAAKEVFDSVVNYQKIAAIAQSQEEKLLLAKKSYELEYLKFSNGIVSMMEVLSYDDLYLQNKIIMIEKDNQKYQYYVDCIKALGGGFETKEKVPYE